MSSDMNISIRTIASLLGTSLRETGAYSEIDTLLIDSRSLSAPTGTLFFAIPTSENDGHRYMRPLYDRGVRNFVANRIPSDMKGISDANILLVDDTRQALQTIGAYCRRQFGGKVAAIAGSQGKTTLKEWLFQLLEPLMPVFRSPRSYNSQIGVPLSLWQIAPDSRIALIEAGVSRHGEMSRLEECIHPDTVIFTNIGDAHADGFDSPDDKAAEKALLASGTARTIIYRRDYPLLRKALVPYAEGREVIDWSTSDPKARLLITVGAGNGMTSRVAYRFGDMQGEIDAPAATESQLENTGNAITFLLSAGIRPEEASGRFPELAGIHTRLGVSEGVNGCTLLYDSYTSDFSSLGPALDVLRRRTTPGQLPALILSDLRHEAGATPDLYARISTAIQASGIRRLIGVGPNLCRHRDCFPPDAQFFRTTSELLERLSPSDFSNEIILLKGSPEFEFGRILEMLEARKHETVLEVNLDSIIKNYNYFRSHVPASTGLIAMVKASGYGAGSREIAKTLQDAGAAYLAVAVLDEGIDLRRNGITMPIMVMNPKVVNYRSMFAHRLEPEIYSMEMLSDVIREARKNGVTGYPIHIKLDTGMHRMGFVESELPALMEILESQDAVRAETVFSHLATADCPDMNDYTELQLRRFADYTDYMLSRSSHPIKRHVLNSAGILRYPEHHYDFVRLGIGLYGANTLPEDMEKPLAVVSTLRTVIIAIREWEAGESIGYGRRTVLKRRSRIATIPIGYADGFNRHFGRGNVSVKVNGHDAPTVGNICMDACMIDVTGIECKVGDDVEIFGRQAPLQRLADLLDTIPYEILTSVSPRVKRIYYRES